VRGFIGQEATHRRVHARFNGHLQHAGPGQPLGAAHRPPADSGLKTLDVRAWLGVTAATEHFTAILAEHLLRHPARWTVPSHACKTMWLWHASEEAEHRSTAFDLYRALGGNERWRRAAVLRVVVTFHFCTDLLRQTVHNLWRDGSLAAHPHLGTGLALPVRPAGAGAGAVGALA
jgi:predicted metal-dependent hydrolase